MRWLTLAGLVVRLINRGLEKGCCICDHKGMRYTKAHVLATTPASERWSGPRIILTITQTGFKRGFQRDLHEMKLLALHKELVWPTTYQCWHSKYLGIHWVPACLTTVKNLRDRSVDHSSSSVWIRYSCHARDNQSHPSGNRWEFDKPLSSIFIYIMYLLIYHSDAPVDHAS